MRVHRLLEIAAGLVFGLVLSASKPAYVLIFTGFWMGAMWVVWLPGALMAWMLGRGKALKVLLPFSLASAGSFAVAFPMVGLAEGEGAPVSATAVGAWMVLWLMVVVRGTGELITLSSRRAAREDMSR